MINRAEGVGVSVGLDQRHSFVGRLRWGAGVVLGLLLACRPSERLETQIPESNAVQVEPKLDVRAPEIEADQGIIGHTARYIHQNSSLCDPNPPVAEEVESVPPGECSQKRQNVKSLLKKIVRLGNKKKFKEMGLQLMEVDWCLQDEEDMRTLLSLAHANQDSSVMTWIMQSVVGSITADNIEFVRGYLGRANSRARHELMRAVAKNNVDYEYEDEEMTTLMSDLFEDMVEFALLDTAPAIRKWGVYRLAETPTEINISRILLIAETDTDMEVRELAIQVLGKLPPLHEKNESGEEVDRINETLVNIINRTEHPDSEPSLREAAARALMPRQGEGVTDILIVFSENYTSSVGFFANGRRRAIDILGCRAGRVAEEALLKVLWEGVDWEFEEGLPPDRFKKRGEVTFQSTERQQRIESQAWRSAIEALKNHVETNPSARGWIEGELKKIVRELEANGNNPELLEIIDSAIEDLPSTTTDELFKIVRGFSIDEIKSIRRQEKPLSATQKDNIDSQLWSIKNSFTYLLSHGDEGWVDELKVLKTEIQDDPDLEDVLKIVNETLKKAEEIK